MAREATKAADNVWYKARIDASKYNDKLRSREGAAELLGMSVSAVSNTELGLDKCMPVDKAVLMADLYCAPHLKNYYCLHECPIGKDSALSEKVVGIERVVVKLMKNLNTEALNEIQNDLLSIAYDGDVSEEELPDLQRAIDYLNMVSKTISELRTIAEIAMKGKLK